MEYWYTDLSPAFLDQAERRFGPGRDHLRYGRWDVTAPGAGERLTGGDCDVIVATNVLHATRDIRAVLRNLAAALRPGGVLVVNEVTRKSAILTLTFGLLDGWWLDDDEDVRLPGAPLLSASRWQEVLRDTGYGEEWRPVAEPDAFGEVFVAQRGRGEVAPPEGTRLLVRRWEPAPALAGRAPAAVAVLGAGPHAARLADALPGARLIASAADVGDRFDARSTSAGSASTTGCRCSSAWPDDEALLLGVGPGDARAGLYRMLQSEYGRVRSRYLEADPADADLPDLVARELAEGGDDTEVTYRRGSRQRAVLEALPAAMGAPVDFPAHEPLLITGGTRGIGLALARARGQGVGREDPRPHRARAAAAASGVGTARHGHRARPQARRAASAGARRGPPEGPLAAAGRGRGRRPHRLGRDPRGVRTDRRGAARRRTRGPGQPRLRTEAGRGRARGARPQDGRGRCPSRRAGRRSAAVLRAVLLRRLDGPRRGRGTERLRDGQRPPGRRRPPRAPRAARAERGLAELAGRRHGR